MPYISQSDRDQLDKAIEDLMIAVIKLEDKDGKKVIAGPGVYNYIFSKLLALTYGYQPSYSKINEAIGILECAKMEFYRRVGVPYEDVKIRENSDVYPSMSVPIDSSH